MNAGQLIEKVEQELRWAPAAVRHHDDLLSKLNDKLVETVVSQPWRFRQRLHTLELYADVEATFGVTNGSQLVTGTGFFAAYEGATFVKPNADDTAADLPTVVRVVDSTNLIISEAYDGATDAAADATVRWDRYTMPINHADILGIMSREDQRGEVIYADRTLEKGLMLNRTDSPGGSECFIYDGARQIRGPRREMAAATAAGGALTAGVTYRYLYAFWYDGVFSPESNIVEATPSGADLTVNLSNLETQAANTGRVKYLYRDDGDGVFRFLATVETVTSTYSDTGAVAPDEDRRWEQPAIWHDYRFWPRPSQGVNVEVRYLARPARMLHDRDEPFFPDEYQMILVHKVVSDIAGRHGGKDQVALHDRLGEEQLKRMRARYLTSKADTSGREYWSPGGRIGGYVRRPNIEWTG